MSYKTNRYYIFDIEWLSIHKKILGVWVIVYEKQVTNENKRYVNERVLYLKNKGHFVYCNH